MKKKIIITGASGYIGSCLFSFLKKKYKVFLIDKIFPQKFKKIPTNLFYKCNLLNKKRLDSVFKKIKPDVVIHLAAQSTVDEKIPLKNYNLNNVVTTKNLISIMKKNLINKLIFSSTAAVYEEKLKKISEEDNLKPISKYGKTKLLAEKLLSKEKKISSIILRFFNVCGAFRDPLIGEFHQPETHLIPRAVSSALKKIPIKIYGNDYLTKDRTCIRDYIHIFDICTGIEKSISYLSNNLGRSDIFNLGSGEGFSIKQIIFNLGSVIKKKLKIKILDRRKGDVPYLVCNIKKAKKILKWKPKKTKIKTILADDIYWNEYLVKKKLFRQ